MRFVANGVRLQLHALAYNLANFLRTLATPATIESDIHRFVDLSKDFKGKAAMEARGVRVSCVTLLIDGPEDADPWGREALVLPDGPDGGEHVGRLTSGGYSVAYGRQIGIGYVRPTWPRRGPGSSSACSASSGTPRWPRRAPTTRRTSGFGLTGQGLHYCQIWTGNQAVDFARIPENRRFLTTPLPGAMKCQAVQDRKRDVAILLRLDQNGRD